MNIGYEDEELKPYVEPMKDFNDTNRIGKSKWLGVDKQGQSVFGYHGDITMVTDS